MPPYARCAALCCAVWSVRHDDAAVWDVLEAVALAAQVRAFDDGLAHALTDNGGNLSQGTRQLICMGRCVHRRRVLACVGRGHHSSRAVGWAVVRHHHQRCLQRGGACSVREPPPPFAGPPLGAADTLAETTNDRPNRDGTRWRTD